MQGIGEIMKTILIVEDNDDVRTTLAEIFSCMGHNVHAAIHGQDALNSLSNIPVPSLIFLDIMMPVMDGPSFYRELRKQKHFDHVPVVVFSAVEDKYRLDGVAGHLRKPASLDDLMVYVTKYCS